MKTKYLFILIASILLFSCSKKDKINDKKKALIANFFPLGPNNFWKVYYHAPYGGPTAYEVGVDSFFVSMDTVGLNTISNNGNIIDTNWLVYNIIKVKRTRKDFLDLTIYHEPLKNFGIVRVDTASLRVYTAIPACTCWTMPTILPNYGYFQEITLFDYNLQTNSTVSLVAQGFDYNTTVAVDSFLYNGNMIKKQYFFDILNPTDTVTTRMQFGSILNTCRFITEVVSNTSFIPNAYVDSMFFFYNLNDSLLIKLDTDCIP